MASSLSVRWVQGLLLEEVRQESLQWAWWLRGMACGDIGKLIQGMLSWAKSPAEVINVPPAAFRRPWNSNGDRKWLDRSKVERLQGSYWGARSNLAVIDGTTRERTIKGRRTEPCQAGAKTSFSATPCPMWNHKNKGIWSWAGHKRWENEWEPEVQKCMALVGENYLNLPVGS